MFSFSRLNSEKSRTFPVWSIISDTANNLFFSLTMREFQDEMVKLVFENFPDPQLKRLYELRELIFTVADSDDRIGPLLEQLRWGEPSYITERSKSGSTVRIGIFQKKDIACFFHCQTTLVESFRYEFSDRLNFSKNRAIVIDPSRPLDTDILSRCIHKSLIYKLWKKS